MISPERSDVNIDILFKWGKPVHIYDVNGDILNTYYVRLVGDADTNKARVFALRKSAEMRKTLRDPDSDEHVAFIADKEALSKEELIKYVEIFRSRKISSKAYKEVVVPFPKEPDSDAETKELERYQEEVDNFQKKVNDEVTKYINKEVEKLHKELEQKSVDELYKLYEEAVIDDLCENEMLTAFKDYCVYSGLYIDSSCKTKVFSGLDLYKALPTDIKKQFETEYDSIEIDVETLKKLREAMP